jgi:cyclopropane-fatty-acyl-phospholipid synthase
MESIVPSEVPETHLAKPGILDRQARRVVLALLKELQRGRLTVYEEDEVRVFGETSPQCDLKASITVHHPRCYTKLLFGGSVGAGEAYMSGYWSSDTLTEVMRILTLNVEVLTRMDRKWRRLMIPVHNVLHALRRNTLQGSRHNIAAHYDLGNDFYALFLDDTMTYSCGIFEHSHSNLQDASIAKYDRICRKLRLKPEDRVLEVGSGWGGFALHAATRYGCRVTAATLSQEQYGFTRERVRSAGLDERIETRLTDYRKLSGTFDKIVSIEMIEAVGHQYFDEFFRKCSELLTKDGMMALQSIVVADRFYEEAMRSVDFIKRYIFPGGCLPSVSVLSDSIARVTDLQIVHLEDIASHYALTLKKWRQRFLKNIDSVRNMGYPESFIRMWEYYLSLCEGAFMERHIGNVQMLLTKPLNRTEPFLPHVT